MGKSFRRPEARRPGKIRSDVADEPNPNSLHPSFCFKYLQKDEFDACEKEEQLGLIRKMVRIGSLQWIQVIHAPKHGLGLETMPIERVNKPRPPCVPENEKKYMVLRFDGTRAMIGFRNKKVFYALWLDRDFSAYDHG